MNPVTGITGMSNFSPGYSYASYGSPVFNDFAFVSVPQQNLTSQRRPPQSSELNVLASYLAVLLAESWIGPNRVQRIIYNKATRDVMNSGGIGFNLRYVGSLLAFTPIIVIAQEITSQTAVDKRERICAQPLNTGSGSQSIERFYYDTGTDTCKTFTYKGTLGNENNFKSLLSCSLRCRPFSSEGQTALKREILKAYAVDSFVFFGSSKWDALRTAIYTVFVAQAIGQL